MIGRAKTEARKDAGRLDSGPIGPTEDAARRRFAAAESRETSGTEHFHFPILTLARGSSASRTPSPSTFSASTVSTIMMPGAIATIGRV
jgi:hypothetical protein